MASVIPFVPGRRPTDEARHPWLGSSDQVAFVNAGEGNRCYLLLRAEGDEELVVNGRVVEPLAFVDGVLQPHPLGDDRPYVVVFDPDADFAGPYDFAHRFTQRVPVTVNDAVTEIEVYDISRFGSLYERIIERLLRPDAAAQGVELAQHPWYPVLLIGSHKAELYTRALVGDIVHKRHNLADPGWLTRVGLYLELLTCLGVFAAVEPSLLSPEEQAVADGWDDLTLNVEGWREVWRLREVQPGPRNLLAKRRATLEFLHVHHEDLKRAIELAGANHINAQETWHRVFRDAERAVLRQTRDAFPELNPLPAEVRRFVLWHQRGHIGLKRALKLPGPPMLGDQDGIFPSACNQYRASMNDVADWARSRGLMDHSGEECVPRQVSLLEAHMNQPTRVGLLQARDGYDPAEPLKVGVDLPPGYTPPVADLRAFLRRMPLFAPLTDAEVDQLALTARPLTFGPLERVLVQGQPGESLFVVVEGSVDVMLRREDGREVNLGARAAGAVLGEMSLLTGQPRSATVRALDGAVIYEIGRRQYEPLLAARPELIGALERSMQERLRVQGALLERHDRGRGGLMRRLGLVSGS